MAATDDVVIQVKGVSKNFLLPHERAGSFKGIFVNSFRSSMHKKVNVQHALRDVSFDIRKGEFFGIVGRNGSGKSTLLKLLAGIYQPTQGSITTRGKLVPFIELGVGFNPDLTGRQNVYLNGALLGFSEKEIREQYDEIVSFAELKDFMDQKLKNYSSGMQVRLAFSMAVRAKADILLIDEVLAVGDANFQRKCFDYFRSLKKNHKTVVFVGHDMNAIREYCDRGILIDDSRLIVSGNAEKIANEYTRIFTKEAEQQEDTIDSKEGKRWGNGAVRIKRVAVGPKQTIKHTDKTISLTVTMQAKEAVKDPICGFLIKTATGQSIVGTNTKIKHQFVGDIKAGQTFRVTWSLPNIFNEGWHSVEPAVVDSETLEVCDWWEEATRFKVVRSEHTPYIIAPDINLEIEKK